MAESINPADTATAMTARIASVPAPTQMMATPVENVAPQHADPWVAAERTHEELIQQQQRAVDDSGTYSTLSSSALGSIGAVPMHTIGPKRGADLIKSRPKILAPSPRHDRSSPSALNASFPDFEGGTRKSSQLKQELPGADNHSRNNKLDYGSHDDSTADAAAVSGQRKTFASHAAARQHFYQLGGPEVNTRDGSDRSGHVLSSEALAMHDALWESELAAIDPKIMHAVTTSVLAPIDDCVADFRQRAVKVSTGTLGSPFGVIAGETTKAKQAKAANVDRDGGGDDDDDDDDREPVRDFKNGTPKHAQAAEKVSFLRKAALPSVDLHEHAKAALKQATNSVNRKVSKKPPPVSGLSSAAQERQRTTSGGSADGGYRKDDLLGKLASAVKKERKLRSDYQHELNLANDELEKIFEAETARDAEMTRLQGRHTRDKLIISQLKLKLEKLTLELARAEEVDAHEAEVYLDLLMDQSAGRELDSDSDIADATVSRTAAIEGHEKSMSQLLTEQDAVADSETQDWTSKAIAAHKARRERFKAKMKTEQNAYNAVYPHQRGAIDATNEDLKRAKLVCRSRPSPPKLINPANAPPAGRARKVSDTLKDSVRRLIGLPTVAVARQESYQRKAHAVRVNCPPLSPMPMDLQAFDARVRAVAQEIEDNPLPPIITETKPNKRPSKGNRLAALVQPADEAGTWGRSSSMDVPRPRHQDQPAKLGARPSRKIDHVMHRSGYSSDPELPSGNAGFFANVSEPAVGQLRGPPPVSGTRYGALSNSDSFRNRFGIKRRSSKSGSDQDSATATGQMSDVRPRANSKDGRGFFKYLFPNLAEPREADGDLTTSSQDVRIAPLGSNLSYSRGHRPSLGVQDCETQQASAMESVRRRASGRASFSAWTAVAPTPVGFVVQDKRTWSQQLPYDTVRLPVSEVQSNWS